MIAVLQRVTEAKCTIAGQISAQIRTGLLVLLGIEEADTKEDLEWLSKKIVNLRIFDDEAGVMNRSLLDVKGELLLISQFTLHASTKKGNRPSYSKAAKPAVAIPLYEATIAQLQSEMGHPIQTGQFGADMKIALLNDGPVTIIIDTKDRK